MAEEAHHSGIAERYALAVFELATEQKAVDTVLADLRALKAAVLASPDLYRFVRAPVFGREALKKGMTAILQAMGACKLTEKFVLTLAVKGRLFVLMDAIAAYHDLVAKSRGEISAEVASARPLLDTEIAEIKAALKSKLGQEPKLDARVDPSLLGGLVVKVGSKMIDSSIRAKLNGLRLAMRG